MSRRGPHMEGGVTDADDTRRLMPIVSLGVVLTLLIVLVMGAVSLVGSAADDARGPIDVGLRFDVVAEGFERPVFVTGAGDGSGDRYVIEQRGAIMRILPDGRVEEEPFLDIEDRVHYFHEQGFLGLVFHPDFEVNGRLFVAYTRRPDGATALSEFTLPAEPEEPEAGEEGEEPEEPTPIEQSERPLLVLAQPYDTHKAGMLAFDEDGMLLMGVGDGGSGGDPLELGLDTSSLLGKLLRLDVDAGWPYALPRDNGFAGRRSVHPEIHAIGLRNPWRYSIDRATGDVYIGDVGQANWEEVNVLPRGSRGVSFGWGDMEGRDCYRDRPCRPRQHALPAVAYAHVEGETGHCSIIGGYAYRGDRGTLPDGLYLYADYCSRTIWGAWARDLVRGVAEPTELAVLDESYGQIHSFGEDDEGELFLATSSGHILHIVGEGGVA